MDSHSLGGGGYISRIDRSGQADEAFEIEFGMACGSVSI